MLIIKFILILSTLPLLAFAEDSTSEVQIAICNPRWSEINSETKTLFKLKSTALMSFYETKSFDLYKQKIQMRKKHNLKKNKTQIVTKVRFQNASQAPSHLKEFYALECEYDYYATASAYTCKYKEKSEAPSETNFALLKDLNRLAENAEIQQMPELHYYEYSAKAALLEGLQLDELTLDFVHRNGLDFIELSTRVPSKQQSFIYSRLLNWAKKQRFTICEKQSDRFSRIYNIK